jgi:hypothetical protein
MRSDFLIFLRAQLVLSTCVLIPVVSPSAQAQGAPSPLYGKSIVATWTEDRMQRLAGKGEFRRQQVPVGLTIYISTAGRTFVRRSSPSRLGGARDSLGAGASAAGAHATRFNGRILNVTASFTEGGARAVSISFDPNYSSCSASVVIGRSGGRIMRMKTYGGTDVEIESITAGGASCGVQSGNAFAQ